MNIRTAYNTMTSKGFVDWALENKYPYFIKISGNIEEGIIFPKRGNKEYRFKHKIKE